MPDFWPYLRASLVLSDVQGIQGLDRPVPARMKIVT
jgi:hypothetical protein